MDLDYLQYKLIVESSPNMIWRAGIDGKCDYFNRTWLAFTGRSLSEELGNGWAHGVHAEDLNKCLDIYLTSFAKRAPFEMEYRLLRFDGQYRWINDRGVPIYDKGNFIGYIGSCMDVTEKVEGQLFKNQAQIDGLCQIYNRQHVENLLNHELQFAHQNNYDFAVIMLDIDNFKLVNDQYGHLFGDVVLKQVAKCVQTGIRSVDMCGRYGGEEFIVGLAHTDQTKVWEIAERLRVSIAENKIFFENNSEKFLTVTVSLGISFLRDNDSLKDLIMRADQGLYLAKQSGKNCSKVI
jgi:diguanylate cyclase (GGDEF)-like protein/PAS domain S-box-containing protein